MCEEVSLLAAHLCMLPTLHTQCMEEDEQMCEAEPECRVGGAGGVGVVGEEVGEGQIVGVGVEETAQP